MLEFDAETNARLERAYRGRDFVRRRAANIDALDPKPGEAILDIGCGTGPMLAAIAGAVGAAGRATGVEPSADMRARSEATCAGLDTVRIVDGTADALPVGDASQDGIVSVQVFEYLTDIPVALAECRRVLKPGGRLVIGDMHFGTLSWATGDADRHARVVRAWDAHFAEDRVPEILPGLLGAAGFRLRRAIPVPVVDTGPAPDGMAAMMQLLMADFAHRSGAVPEAEARAWSDDLDERSAAGTYFFTITHVVTVAEAI